MIRSVKVRLAASSLLLFFLVLALLSWLLYQDVKESAFEREAEAAGYSLHLAMSNAESGYSQVLQYIIWLNNSAEVTEFMTSRGGSLYNYQKVKTSIAAGRQLFTMALSSGVVEKLFISSVGGDHITVGSSYGNTNDWENAQPYLMRATGETEHAVIDSPFDYGISEQLIVRSEELRSFSDNRLLGWADAFISPRLFSGLGVNTYVAIKGVLFAIDNDRLIEAPCAPDILAPASYRMMGNGVRLCYGTIGDYSGPYLIATSSINQWTYIRTFPQGGGASPRISSYRSVFIVIAIFLLFAIFFSAILYIMFDLVRQREKKNYAFQVLQSQINPHFLYNTLNSIKWMASLQKADGIAEVTATLASLLRRIARVKDEIITLGEELSFIDDYVIIQRYRYGDMFDVTIHVADEELRRAKIIKFTLQPLIENAIFHGIEPKNAKGTVRVDIARDGDCLVLSVTDDGVGIEPETLARLNDTETVSSADATNIGLSNIRERIRLEYGNRYGLYIDSAVGAYTKCTVRIPLRYGG